MSFGGYGANRSVTTPGRKSHLILDASYPAVKEPPLAFKRESHEICRAGFGPNNSENVTRMGNGGIGLRSIQETPGKLAETTSGNSLVIAKSAFSFPSGMLIAERPMFRQQTELTGNSYDAGVTASGDNFLVKQVTAGETWARSHTADVTAFGQAPIEPSYHNPYDRIGVGTSTYATDTGFCWRFEVTGTNLNKRQMIGAFYFGGPVAAGSVGQFCLAVDGTGQAKLFEKTGEGASEWTGRHKFRYAPADRVSGSVHEIIIKPYLSQSSLWLGFIDFIVHHTDSATARGGMVQSLYQEPLLTDISVYTVYRRPDDSGTLRPNVTGAGNVRYDQPRETRNPNQFSRLGYPDEGWFTDFPFFVPFGVGTGQNITIQWDGSIPSATTMIVGLINEFTGAELTLLSSTANSRTYSYPTGGTHFYARGEFTSDGTATPILTQYRVFRDGLIVELSGSDLDIEDEGGEILDVSVTGPEADPSHETASIVVDDKRDALTVLNSRGRVAVRLETEYDSTDSTKRSVLFEGFFIRTPGQRHTHKEKEGFSGGGATRLYPAAKWRTFFGTGMGMWIRLREKISWQLFDFTKDETNPNLGPWKVTDVVRRLISYCGFPDDQIDVPDNSMRLFASIGQSPQGTFTITPGQEIGEVIQRLLSDYLGWFIVWDGNAGSRGMWRARGPNIPPYTNLATFRTARTGSGVKAAHHAGAYGNAAGGYYSESGAVTGFIRKGSLETYVKPPEANAVLVIGGGSELPNKSGNYHFANWLVNRDGLDYFPNYTVDPQNPDYIGELVPLLYVDFGLQSQAATDFMTFRIFHVACHGIKMAKFESPLLLITDPNDVEQTQPRPLQFYDPVQIIDGGVTSQWLVRNVNPFIRKGDGRDGSQWMGIELEAPRAPYA